MKSQVLLCLALACLGCQSQATPPPAKESKAPNPAVDVFSEAADELIKKLEAHIESHDIGGHYYVVGINTFGLRDRGSPVPVGTLLDCRDVLQEALKTSKRLTYSDAGSSMHGSVNGQVSAKAISAKETEYTVQLEVRSQGKDRAVICSAEASKVAAR